MPSNPEGLRAGWQPSNPDGGGSWQPSNPARNKAGARASRTPADAFDARAINGWEGVDPPWTYADEHTLLMQALRKSRAKVARLSDPVAMNEGGPQARSRGARTEALWRWAPKYRIAAVAAELSSRVVVVERSVWLVNPSPHANVPLIHLPQRLDGLPRYTQSEQIDAVLRAAVEREDRLPEILTQASDLWPFFESITGVQLAAAPEFAELLQAAQEWLTGVLMLLKHNIAARRPVQCSSLVMPLIPTPGHGSLPSGHATVAAFNAELLRLLMYSHGFESRVDTLDRLARRIAFNRVVAGVHFPVDSQVGYALGRQLAAAMATLAGNPQPIGGLGSKEVLVFPYTLAEQLPQNQPQTPRGTPPSCAPAKALSTLWEAAATSLARLRV